jgi:hypothetical protein
MICVWDLCERKEPFGVVAAAASNVAVAVAVGACKNYFLKIVGKEHWHTPGGLLSNPFKLLLLVTPNSI